MTAIEIRTAPDGMPPVRCMDCLGQIRPGHEFWTERWPNSGGFDYHHYNCSDVAVEHSPDPSRRVVQGTPTSRRTK